MKAQPVQAFSFKQMANLRQAGLNEDAMGKIAHRLDALRAYKDMIEHPLKLAKIDERQMISERFGAGVGAVKRENSALEGLCNTLLETSKDAERSQHTVSLKAADGKRTLEIASSVEALAISLATHDNGQGPRGIIALRIPRASDTVVSAELNSEQAVQALGEFIAKPEIRKMLARAVDSQLREAKNQLSAIRKAADDAICEAYKIGDAIRKLTA